nr:GTPase ObgE [Chthoniobacterales bacterium]
DLQSLRREIDLYDATLSRRPWGIVANKMDLPGAEENLALVRERFAPISVIPIAAEKGEGVAEFKEQLARWIVDPQNTTGAKCVKSESVVTRE